MTVEQLVEHRPTQLLWFNKQLTAADAPALTNAQQGAGAGHVA